MMIFSNRTSTTVVLLVVVVCLLESAQAWLGGGSQSNKATGRRLLFQKTLGSFLAIGTTKAILRQQQPAALAPPPDTVPTTTDAYASFVYSDEWTGTALSLVTIQESASMFTATSSSSSTNNNNNDNDSIDGSWPMARWPDPILRHVADPVPHELFGTAALQTACRRLEQTAMREQAVGLAAQQCGVNARIVYLERSTSSSSSSSSSSKQEGGPWHWHAPLLLTASASLAALTMINPRIVQRSPETEMRVWTEHCLVLPPTLEATVLRDVWVDVAFQTLTGEWQRERLVGEVARAAQHELDHDRGILVTDHVSLDELESDVMRSIEQPGHDQRMALAYARTVEEEEHN
jgi:peptide deformylase